MAATNFWDNPETAKQTVNRLKALKAIVDPVRAAASRSEDLHAMLELLAEEEDAEARAELDASLVTLCREVDQVELLTFLSEPNDIRNGYFGIQAGTGGRMRATGRKCCFGYT